MSEQTKPVKKENEGLGYALQCIALQSVKCLHPCKLKSMWQNSTEKRLYLSSIVVNPIGLYFLTHNKYFFMRINIKLYIMAGLFGYFAQKGTVLAFKENREKVGGKNHSLVNRHIVTKHEKQLCDVLNSLNIPHEIAKTNVNEFATQIYVLSNVPIKTILNSEREVAKRMNLENSNLSISIDKSYFVFDVRNSKQNVYYFDEYLDKIDKKQLKEKELPFVLGIRQSTGKLIIEDLSKLLNMLIAGTPGSGKSCFINNLIQSMMIFENNCLFFLADFKGNELNQYRDFVNCTFITKHEQLNKVLDDLIKEMESRYKKLGNCKNIRDYNANAKDKLPYIILLVDEMACISLCNKELVDEINLKIMDLLNRSRAAGIIFIGAMQRPSSKQIDTNVRANLDTKIVCRVSDKKETQFTDTPGAEKLDRGEFLVNAQGYNCERFKGLFIDDKNRNVIFEHLKSKTSKGGLNNGINVNLQK